MTTKIKFLTDCPDEECRSLIYRHSDLQARFRLIDWAEREYNSGNFAGCAALFHAEMYLSDRLFYALYPPPGKWAIPVGDWRPGFHLPRTGARSEGKTQMNDEAAVERARQWLNANWNLRWRRANPTSRLASSDREVFNLADYAASETERADRAEQRVAELEKEIADARLVMIEEGDPGREWSKDDSLAEWVRQFGIDREAEGAKTGRERGWISVSERLPEPSALNLLLVDGRPSTGRYVADSGIPCMRRYWLIITPDGPEPFNFDQVTHWMPLPAPPASDSQLTVGGIPVRLDPTVAPTEIQLRPASQEGSKP